MTAITQSSRKSKSTACRHARLLRRYPELREIDDQYHVLALEWTESSKTRLGLRRGAMARWTRLALWFVGLILISLGMGFLAVPEVLDVSWDELLINQAWITWPVGAWPTYAALGAVLLSPLFIMLALSVSRFLLRRGLYKRDSCQTCGYALTGTKFTESSLVECPECRTAVTAFSTECRADGSFAPWKPVTQSSWRLLWPPFAYVITLTMILIALFGGYGMAQMAYRYQAYRDAELARAWMPTEADFNNVLAMIGPPQTEDRRFADGILSIKSDLEMISKRWQASLPPTANLRYFDVWSLTNSNKGVDEDEIRKFTRMVLDTWLAEGGETEFLKLLSYPVISAKYDPASEIPGLPDHTVSPTSAPVGIVELRFAARLGIWMIQSAMEQNDQQLAVQSASALTKFSEQCLQDPILISQVFALNTRLPLMYVVHDQLKRLAIASPPTTGSWLDSLSEMLDEDAALDRHLPASIEGEALSIRQSTARTFSNARSIADGSYEAALRKSLGDLSEWGWLDSPEEPMRLGLFEHNRNAAQQIAAWMREAALAPRWLRPASPRFSSLLFYSHVPSALGRYLGLLDTHRQAVIALGCLIALERYRLQHNDYPESLDALPGGPYIDLYNQGKPLQYRKQSTTDRPMFLLYSVGHDGIDNKALPNELPFLFIYTTNLQVDNVFSPDWNPPTFPPSTR